MQALTTRVEELLVEVEWQMKKAKETLRKEIKTRENMWREVEKLWEEWLIKMSSRMEVQKKPRQN